MAASDKPLIILHGWSDKSTSFRPLGEWLQKQGFKTIDIWLGDYISLHDKITIEDLGCALQRALTANGITQTRHSFDLIIHSTGALVAREYVRQACRTETGPDAQRTPVRRMVMLAPANFGSPLASLGKSVLGRILKGWRWDDLRHAGESGQRILEALEFASPLSWRLAVADLFDPAFPVYSTKHTLATVLVGSAPYSGVREISHEPGGDGTVRVATANLNATWLSLDFADPSKPLVTAKPRTAGDIAFAVFDRNHGTITQPPDNNNLPQEKEWADLLLAALRVTPASYPTHVSACTQQTSALFSAREGGNENFHRYMHVVFHVHDQYGAPVPDYVVDFFQRLDPSDKAYRAIHGKILEKVTTHSVDSSFRSFFFDVTDLEAFLAQFPKSAVEMSVGAAALSDDIYYRNPHSKDVGVSVFSGENKRLLHPHEPVLVDVTLYRDPEEKVFRLKKL